MTCTYKEKIHVVHLDYYNEIRGEKTHGRNRLYVRGRGGGLQSIVKEKTEEGVIDKKKIKIQGMLCTKIIGRERGETKCKITRRIFNCQH